MSVFDVACVPPDDPHFWNAVRVVVEFVRVSEPPRERDVAVWEGALRHGFGYQLAEARVSREPGDGTMVTFYREGVRRAAMLRSHSSRRNAA